MQASVGCNKSFITVVKDIYKEGGQGIKIPNLANKVCGGLKIFYRGFHFALMRAMPLHVGTFATIELLKKHY